LDILMFILMVVMSRVSGIPMYCIKLYDWTLAYYS